MSHGAGSSSSSMLRFQILRVMPGTLRGWLMDLDPLLVVVCFGQP